MISREKLLNLLNGFSSLSEKHSVTAFRESLQTTIDLMTDLTPYEITIAGKSSQNSLTVVASTNKGLIGNAIPLEGTTKHAVLEGTQIYDQDESEEYETVIPLRVEHLPIGVMRIKDPQEIQQDSQFSFCLDACTYSLNRLIGNYNVATLAHESKNMVLALKDKVSQLPDSQNLEDLLTKAQKTLEPLYRDYKEPAFSFDPDEEEETLYATALDFFEESLSQFNETRTTAITTTQQALTHVKNTTENEDILAACDDLQTMTDYLQRNTIEFYPREINLDNTLQEILYGQGGIADLLGDKIELVFEPGYGKNLRVDERTLHQMTLNTLMNAKRALDNITESEWNGVRNQEKRRITIRTSDQNNTAVIEYQDNALGVPIKIQKNWGKPWNKSSDPESNGLGIAHCCDEATKHGGHYIIQSTDQTGTTLEFAVPNIRYNPLKAITFFEELVKWVEEGQDYQSFCQGSEEDQSYKGMYRMVHAISHLLENTRVTTNKDMYIKTLDRLRTFKEFWQQNSDRLAQKSEEQPDLIIDDSEHMQNGTKTLSYFVHQTPFVLSLHEAAIYKSIALHHGNDHPDRAEYFAKSISTLDECMALAGTNTVNKAKALNNKGNVFGYMGDLDSALESYKQAQECLTQITDYLDNIDSLRGLTEVKTAEGYWLSMSDRYDEAEESLTQAISYASRLAEMDEAPLLLSYALGNMAELRYRQGKDEEAIKFATESIEVSEKPFYITNIIDSLCVRIIANHRLGKEKNRKDIDQITRLMDVNDIHPTNDLYQTLEIVRAA
jgi:tetratricopeptide (TPR) repeat protein